MRIAQEALTFDDVLLLPAYSNVMPRDVNLTTKLTRNINIIFRYYQRQWIL